MDIVKKLASMVSFGVVLLVIAAVGVRFDHLHKTSSGGYETNVFSKIYVLIGWIGIAIVLAGLFRFLKHRATKP